VDRGRGSRLGPGFVGMTRGARSTRRSPCTSSTRGHPGARPAHSFHGHRRPGVQFGGVRPLGEALHLGHARQAENPPKLAYRPSTRTVIQCRSTIAGSSRRKGESAASRVAVWAPRAHAKVRRVMRTTCRPPGRDATNAA
jgi:hypothetical protein